MEGIKKLSNVVIVCDHAHVNGGAARVALASAGALAELGIKVHVFAAVGPVSSDLEAVPNLTVTCLGEQPYNASSLRRSMIAGLWDPRAEEDFDRILEATPVKGTVVHCHSNRDALSSSVFSPVFKRKLPLIYTCHEYGLACPYSSFFDHKTDTICRRRGLSAGCLLAHCNRKGYDKKLWTFAKQSIQNGYLGLPNRIGDIVFVSEFSKQIIEPYLGPRPRRHLVSNPVNARRGQKRRLEPQAPFVFVGLLTPGKGPLQAAEAARLAGVPIRFVGDGDMRESILKANPDAVVTGWLSPDLVREEMLAARAIVLPTLWYETQGLVVQEAASVALPAIVSRSCAASEMIEHGRNGFLVEPNSVQELAGMLTKLLDDGVACEMGEDAYQQFWSDPPTLDRHVRQLLPIYEGALSHG